MKLHIYKIVINGILKILVHVHIFRQPDTKNGIGFMAENILTVAHILVEKEMPVEPYAVFSRISAAVHRAGVRLFIHVVQMKRYERGQSGFMQKHLLYHNTSGFSSIGFGKIIL